MDRKLDLTVGQDVVIRYINDSIRYNKDKSIENINEWTTDGVVTKVGRKFIEVKVNGFLKKFDIEFDYNQKVRVGSPDYKLYLSKEEIVEEIKCEELYRNVKNNFDGYGGNKGKFTLDQLERIISIINENNSK